MRRPARLERCGALGPRDRVWAAIRIFGSAPFPEAQEFSIAELMAMSEQRGDTVLPYVKGLEKAGYIEPAPRWLPDGRVRARFMLRRYRLVRDVGVDAPRVDAHGRPVTGGLAQQQIWTVVRKKKEDFDWRDVHQGCDVRMTVDTLKAYLAALERGGYMRVTAEARPRWPSRYRFIRARDTGPRAPLVDRDGRVIDGNTGAAVHEPKEAK